LISFGEFRKFETSGWADACYKRMYGSNNFKHLYFISATGVINATSPADCNFEQQTICNYIQDPNDNFDWSWQTGTTSSSNTGPSNDHTEGSSAGRCAS